MDTPTPVRLVLYDKPGCHLCDEALAVVERVRAAIASQVPTTLERFDIRRDPALWDLYRLEIPVLEVDGRPAFRLRVDPERLRARLVDGVPGPWEA